MDKNISISIDKNSVDPAEAAVLYIELGWGTAKEYSTARMRRSIANCDIVVSAIAVGTSPAGSYTLVLKIADKVLKALPIVVHKFRHPDFGDFEGTPTRRSS